MEVINKIYKYSEPNLTLVGWMGFIGFPLYYYVWSYVFPQAYESLFLRGLGALLFSGIAFRKCFPKPLQKYTPIYYLFTVGFCLPFFFSYMMFMNDWSTIWTMSFMASIFLHILLVHDTKVMAIQAALCIFIAYLFAYVFNPHPPVIHVVWEYLPIFSFTYIFGTLFYFRNQVEHETKASIAKSFGAGIAHEMRNPLSALKASFDVLESIIPSKGKAAGAYYHLSSQELGLIEEILHDASDTIQNANQTIDLLLTSIDETRVSTSTFRKHQMKEVVDGAIHSFPYKKASDQQAVKVVTLNDFEFLGSETLLRYSLYNLLKNAFYYQTSADFYITITLKSSKGWNQLVFRDSGAGIEDDVMEHIFKDFYTVGKSNSYGLGLPFCKKVMHAVGGDISCRSELGKWTEFTLSFPRYDSATVGKLKMDLMRNKSILYIGNTSMLERHLFEQSFYKGYRLHSIDLSVALAKQEYEFEFDIILIDLDTMKGKRDQFKVLESKLTFTEARIVYLFDEHHTYHSDFDRHLIIFPVEKSRFMQDSQQVFDELMFESPIADRNLVPRKKAIYGKTIMIADDNHSLRTYTAIFLEKQGYQVIQAQDGAQAIQQLEKHPVDLVLMDIEMPRLDGIEATNAIRHSAHSYSDIPILAHTGDSSKISIDKIQGAGMNDYIIKPAEGALLIDKISDWL
ncbi:hybrid sensor histidine kinase/response regulator [Vibrio sp. S4M6]|uniref:hybrid sensor histidine kinase/response regulator n=1 Tax=Vibrio sinus TaxID=2946865 RepID=UPI002029C0B1|nr:hybrid sensor histidine kinase/response regulator [Vibrio sinus]MCL9779958.1 hybrid sensor histidine kinase/response regulator [Vibrio sinus]